MAQVAFTVRMDSATKTQFEELCDKFGMSITTAINVFAKSVIQNRGIPFEIKADTNTDAINTGKTKMTEEEFYAKIDKSLAETDNNPKYTMTANESGEEFLKRMIKTAKGNV